MRQIDIEEILMMTIALSFIVLSFWPASDRRDNTNKKEIE